MEREGGQGERDGGAGREGWRGRERGRGAARERERETLMQTETCLIYVIIPGSAKAPHARRQMSCAVCTVKLPTGACVSVRTCVVVCVPEQGTISALDRTVSSPSFSRPIATSRRGLMGCL